MTANIQSIARLVFILSVIFLSIYFILPPSAEESLHIEKTLKEKIIKQSLQKEHQAPQQREALDKKLDKLLVDKRARADQDAIAVTRKVIKEKFKFDLKNYIPGSKSFKSKTNGVKEFRQRLECMTSRGRWEFDLTSRPIIKHKQDPVFGKCDIRFKKSNHSSDDFSNNYLGGEWEFVRESVKYVWKTPDECPMPKFDVKQACSAIYGKKFLLVGDILLFQLHELLLDYFKDGSVQCYGETACKEHALCQIDDNVDKRKVPTMKFIRNDLISLRKSPKTDREIKFMDINVKNLESPWVNQAHSYNVLILNKGHHWQDDETFRNSLVEVIKSLRTKFPDTLIIYKATTLGHLNCHNVERPLPSPPNATELESLPYHWGEIHRHNLIAKEIVEAAGGIFLDLESVMITRADDHIGDQDCLRWCIPGPADVWLDFLFYIMDELKK